MDESEQQRVLPPALADEGAVKASPGNDSPALTRQEHSHLIAFPQSLACSSGGGGGYRDLDGIGLCPDRLAATEIETVHCSLQVASIHFDKEVVVVNLLALEGVTGSAFDGIGVGSCSP
jgi:hypothetical protein